MLALLVLASCAVLFSAVTPGPGPQAQRLLALPRDLLGDLGHHRAVGRRGFVEVVAARWAGGWTLWAPNGVGSILLGVLNFGASLLAVVLHTAR